MARCSSVQVSLGLPGEASMSSESLEPMHIWQKRAFKVRIIRVSNLALLCLGYLIYTMGILIVQLD